MVKVSETDNLLFNDTSELTDSLPLKLTSDFTVSFEPKETSPPTKSFEFIETSPTIFDVDPTNNLELNETSFVAIILPTAKDDAPDDSEFNPNMVDFEEFG
jgi:hypothetical protein